MASALEFVLKARDQATKQMQAVTGQMKIMTAAANNTIRSFANFRNIAITGAVIAIGTSFASAAIKMEMFQSQLLAISGSSKEAARQLHAIREFARLSPLETQDVVEAFIQLRAVGIDPTAKQMETLGSVAVLFGRQMTDVSSALISFEKEVLRRLGIEITRTGDKAIIMSGDVRREVNNDTASIRQALIETWEERFPNAMETAAKTTKSQIAIMKSEWAELNATIGEKIKPFIDDMTKLSAIIGRSIREGITGRKGAATQPELGSGDLGQAAAAADAAAKAKEEAEKARKQAEEYRKRHASDFNEYGAILTETQRKAVEAQEKLNEEWIKNQDEAADKMREWSATIQQQREERIQYYAQRELEILIEKNNRTIEEEKRASELRKEIAQAEYNAKVQMTHSLIDLGSIAIQAALGQGREQQQIAIATGIIQANLAAGFAIAKVWQTAQSWQEGLIASLAVGAEVTAQSLSYVMQMQSQSFKAGGVSKEGPAYLHDNEVIVNPQQQANLLWQLANSRPSMTQNVGGVSVVISGNADANTVRKLEEALPRALQKAYRSGAMRDVMADIRMAA